MVNLIANIKRNVKRSVFQYLLFLFLAIFVLSPIRVKAEEYRVFDDADLYTETEIENLEEEANILSDKYNMDIIIVTTEDAEGKTSREYADDYFDYKGFGIGPNLDGILFLIDTDNREAYISTSGEGIRYLTDYRIENIISRVLNGGLKDGDYYKGTRAFLSTTKGYLEEGIPSNQYSEAEDVKPEKRLTLMETIMSLIAGIGTSSIFFLRTKSKYKMKNPVKPLTFRNNSIVNLASSEERLIDTIITQRRKPKENSSSGDDSGRSSTHTSSSGNTHGGSGGKF